MCQLNPLHERGLFLPLAARLVPKRADERIPQTDRQTVLSGSEERMGDEESRRAENF